MELPKDPMILLSYVNTELRDHFASLDELCEELDVSKEDLKRALSAVEYEYDEERNAFV